MKSLAVSAAILGAVGGTVAAVWLLIGFKPDNPRYTDDGVLFPGEQQSLVVPNLLRDQRKVAALVTASAICQFVGVVLGVFAD